MLTIDASSIFLWIVFSHWVADFIFQDEKWANAKSHNFKALVTHTFTYSFIMTMMWSFYMSNHLDILIFFGITFLIHTFTDYFTSRIVKEKFETKHYGSAIPNFGAFTAIGFDQCIHYATIIGTLLFIQFY